MKELADAAKKNAKTESDEVVNCVKKHDQEECITKKRHARLHEMMQKVDDETGLSLQQKIEKDFSRDNLVRERIEFDINRTFIAEVCVRVWAKPL